ncbi:MAG: bifunctional methylenetetrahydrofolate dehydrogenase/methenyltetrahydrofolate cyclohydrolase FolD [Candidatus Latescibacteria bacterium]|jgi:methylenetetrahydrofolate dehydrogenase (NADP+)/methenyltetrahydrofolate cyclohydrolase|nr:bifunctional methylenetetrahydrofolate dehydrogenase/methenyltetrahydrofolate cyclohydrolase FolD [Gemmatimonadaceae bacterium]MDP6017404.1 bifunctional methylenetetrahydrofolate dehydrogenase/methenyltetrahydrofolate cyclohydrolase FolD [Candidatus Latescibacterota bacterium]MDP7448761.1 bifunctional methylenetetrahydrofolate dehydrogenase/methenyltetrahydrofolate cyclohydrolase FolD [Candidatus Latescibacterota bacterium]HJP30223.1 bifunctional methylenetetrahydrofolate dehydrogenase/methen
MSARILDGQALAKDFRKELKTEVAGLEADHGVVPGLAVVLVGDDPASMSYVKGKRKAAAEVGVYSVESKFDADLPQTDLIAEIERLNADDSVHGILVQLPLPDGLDEEATLNAIDPDKDADGLHPVNLGRLIRGQEGFLPCTPHGVQQILARSGVDVAGKHVVVVGRSTLVGRPLANILTQKGPGANATVTICHTGTKDLAYHTRQADVLVVVTGFRNTVTADMVKPGVVVIDVGVTRIDDASRKRGWRLVGDVDFDGVKEVASAITPVPGGVGPWTITMLLYNTIRGAKRAHGIC